MGRKICLVIGYGQSNERGSAVNAAGDAVKLVSPYGFPIETPGGRSGWPDVLAQILGSEGHAVWVQNMAWGGTGALVAWNGYVRTWQGNSVGFPPGSWCVPTIANGCKYLAGGTPGISQSTGASEPAWTTTINGTTSDGTVTWTCKAAQAQDVNGYVCVQGDTGYDPRGYIAALVSAVETARARGFETWVMTAGHQSDYGVASAAVVSGVLVSMLRRVLAANPARLYLGITNRYVGDASSSQWDAGGFYPTVRSLALAALAADQRVLVGANLGVITEAAMTDPAARVHLNDIGTYYAGRIWRTFVDPGWVP